MSSSIDHFVLTVRDLESTCDFYSRVLGLVVEEFEVGRRTLRFGREKTKQLRAAKTSGSKPTGSLLDLATSAW